MLKKLVFAALLVSSLFPGSQAFADGDVAFAYQGRVKVQGAAFEGTGNFKFAIVSKPDDTVLWTHDATGIIEGVPNGSVALPVVDGIFNVMIGDENSGMSPINSTIFNSKTPLKLRVWFDDGSHGFQQLNPDYNLVNLALTAMQSSLNDFTIYVNGQTGNDRHNGLTPNRAKKTIQAAVDTLPDRIRCNITIDIADGTYPESVKVSGLSVEPGKALRLIGDENWNGAGTPSVRLTGLKGLFNPVVSEDYGFIARQCSGVTIRGLAFDSYRYAAVQMDNGIYEIENCKMTSSTRGLTTADSVSTSSNVHVSNCSDDGFYYVNQSAAGLINCSSMNNRGNGLTLNNGSSAYLQGTGNFSFNNVNGYKVQHHSHIVFGAAAPQFRGIVSGNKNHGLSLTYMSYCENHGTNAFSGNLSGPIQLLYNSITTWTQ